MTSQAWTPEQLQEHFGHREFNTKDIITFLQLPSFHGVGGVIKALNNQHLVDRTMHGYRFRNGTAVDSNAMPVVAPDEQPAGAVLASGTLMIKAKDYYISPGTILIADALQADKITLFTSVLEISDDTTTKFVRSKKLIFTKQHAPDEYAAVMAWLRANSDTPASTPDDAQAALQLAEEAQAKLTLAREEIAQLKTKIAQFRKMLE